MNILTIGNSFSQDATRYIHSIARYDGFDINVTNINIGGCSLERHFRNMHSEARVYELEFNGELTKFNVSLKEALLNRKWDFISLQQASGFSFDYHSFQPYLNELCAYIRKLSPQAKILIHQTWAYEQGSEKLSSTGFKSHTDMFNEIEKAYKNAAKDVMAEFIIPSGELMQNLLSHGVSSVHRDGYHLLKGISRYAVGLLWYGILSGNDINCNSFSDFDEEITNEEIKIIKKAVSEIITNRIG